MNNSNKGYGKIYTGDIVLIAVFLFSIFIHTEFSAVFFGLFSLRKFFFLCTIPFFILALRYRANSMFFVVVAATYILLLVGNIFVSDYLVDQRTLFSLLTYCIPFVFTNKFFNSWSEKGIKYSFLVSLILLTMWKNIGLFSAWNPNCIAYLFFGGINLYLFIPFHFKKYRRGTMGDIFYFMAFLYGIYLLFNTESRNVMIAEIVVVVMVVFKRIMTKKYIYSVVALIAIAYPALMVAFNELLLNNEKLFDVLLTISNEWFGKNTVFDGRLLLQREALEAINVHPILGYGHMPNLDGLATHNNYLTMRYSIGVLGVLLCGVFLVVLFKKAYANFSGDSNDDISFVCISILVGFLIQLGAESFLFGNDLIVLMPYFFMGCIIYRNIHIRNGNSADVDLLKK